MIWHEDTLISEDLLEEHFVCDLSKCKGACCVEGDLGAPLDQDELPILEDIMEEVLPYLSEEGKQALDKQGPWVLDEEGDYSTPTIGGKECAYAFYDNKGVLLCGIEAAYRDGKIDWKKPISCDLYPVRLSQVGEQTALNYDRWEICSPACDLGKAMKQQVFSFLKEPLIRRFGQTWYQELEAINKAYQGHQDEDKKND